MKIATDTPSATYAKPPVKPGEPKPAEAFLPRDSVQLWEAQLPKDQKLHFEVAGGDRFTLQGKAELKSNGVGGWVNGAQKMIQGLLQEVTLGAQSGPCLALTLAGEAVKPIAFTGLSDSQIDDANKMYTPTMRAICMGLSGIQLIERWKHMNRKFEDNQKVGVADYINLGVNGLHVLTCAAGVAGAIARHVSPSMGHLGALGVGIAYAGDALAFGANRLQYFSDRSKTSEAQLQATQDFKDNARKNGLIP